VNGAEIMKRLVPALTFVVSVLAVLGGTGQLPVEMNVVVLHHNLHVLFPTLAFAVFGVYVLDDVRKHGWPHFSWRV
jgi:hypothetical protein